MSEVDRTKRYILFSGYQYYPAGGIEDFVGTFDSVEEARQAAGAKFDWFQIVDRETLEEAS